MIDTEAIIRRKRIQELAKTLQDLIEEEIEKYPDTVFAQSISDSDYTISGLEDGLTAFLTGDNWF